MVLHHSGFACDVYGHRENMTVDARWYFFSSSFFFVVVGSQLSAPERA